MAEVLIEKITQDQLKQRIDENLSPSSHHNTRALASVFCGSTNPDSYHIVTIDSPKFYEFAIENPALLRVIASPNDQSALAVVKFVIVPYHEIPKKSEVHRWIKSGILIRDRSLDDVLSKPNRERWSEGSRTWAIIQTSDPYPSSDSKNEISLHFPRNHSLQSPTLQVNQLDQRTGSWFIDRVVTEFFLKA